MKAVDVPMVWSNERAAFRALIAGRDLERIEEDVWGHPGATAQVQAAAMVGHYTALMRHVANNTWHAGREQAGDGPYDALMMLRCMSRIGTHLHNHHTVMMTTRDEDAFALLFAMCSGMVRDLSTLDVPARWHPEWRRHSGITESVADRWRQLCRIAAHVAGMEVSYGVPARVLRHDPPLPVTAPRWGIGRRAVLEFMGRYREWYWKAHDADRPVRWHPPSEGGSDSLRHDDA